MPYAFLKGGLIPGSITIILVAVLSAYGVRLLLRVKRALVWQAFPTPPPPIARTHEYMAPPPLAFVVPTPLWFAFTLRERITRASRSAPSAVHCVVASRRF